MKTRTIGQCKECEYYRRHYKSWGKCSLAYNDFAIILSPKTTFGCWLWKEKKK